MVPTTSANDNHDPYPPLNWAAEFTAEQDETLRGLLPCEWQCEAGFLPLPDGTMIGCPSCQQG